MIRWGNLKLGDCPQPRAWLSMFPSSVQTLWLCVWWAPDSCLCLGTEDLFFEGSGPVVWSGLYDKVGALAGKRAQGRGEGALMLNRPS